MKVFPKEIYIELNSYVSFLVASAINLCNSLSYFILSLIHNKDTGFWILFISFGILSLCGFILNCFTNEAQINLRERMKKKWQEYNHRYGNISHKKLFDNLVLLRKYVYIFYFFIL